MFEFFKKKKSGEEIEKPEDAYDTASEKEDMEYDADRDVVQNSNGYNGAGEQDGNTGNANGSEKEQAVKKSLSDTEGLISNKPELDESNAESDKTEADENRMQSEKNNKESAEDDTESDDTEDSEGLGMEDTADYENREDEPKKKGFFSRLVAGLTKTRNSINESFNNLFSGFSSIDDDFYDELEETLIMADLGLDTTEKIIDNLKELVKKNHIKQVEECRELVINIIKDQMLVEDEAYDFEEQKSVMLIIGVNGVGKTTSIGKLAAQYKNRGKKVLMCAADTFRAAAIDQLKTWANRAGVEIIAQGEGSDPAAVTFDAVKAAAARNVDILLVDTAGRLHNKKNLMDELAKMKRIIEKEYADAHLETLIVLDGSTGQNALEQARQFSNVTEIDGIILTKLDGTAKGGIAIAIQSELNVPVKYIGVGEHIDDLQRFDPESYVNALFADMDTRSDIEILMPED